MARTGLLYDPVFLEHDSGAGHPERPARLKAIMEHLERVGLTAHCVRLTPPEASIEQLTLVHSEDHVDRLASLSRLGRLVPETPDTLVSPATYRAARRAAGAAIGAVDAVMAGRIDNAFCPVRPPGHHAEYDQAMGFCFFNNIAVAARHLQVRHGLERIAIVDWDVHHCNGTQHCFEDDPSVFVFSVHRHSPGFFPGTGARGERGVGPGIGRTLNVPLPPGSTDADYLDAIRDQLQPALAEFRPQFVLISAGFDAHRADPLGGMALTEAAFEGMTAQLVRMAGDHCQGRLVSVLEGGYNLDALAASAGAHLQVLVEG
jgi:acetoin utilization deacetylase AcuC-like enzyme